MFATCSDRVVVGAKEDGEDVSTVQDRLQGHGVTSTIGTEEGFHPHDIEWSEEAVHRLWAHYGRNPAYKNAYFARHSGHRVIKEATLHAPLRGLIVDLGCGPGYMLEHLLKHPGWAEYVGIDSSPESLAELRRKAQLADRPIRAIHTRDEVSVLEADTADLVLCVEVIEHCDDLALRNVLSCARRLLKPEGYMFLTTPNSENLESSMLMCPECGCRFHHWQHVRSWTPSALREVLAGCGLEAVHVYTCDFSRESTGFKWRDCIRKLLRGRQGGHYSQLHLPHLVAVARKAGG